MLILAFISDIQEARVSTRSLIGRVTNTVPLQFNARYHHFDGYPEGLGKELWRLLHEEFGNDPAKMLRTLVTDHPAGWSTIIQKDWSIPPGFIEYMKRSKTDPADPILHRPQCYCHGDRSERGVLYTEDDIARSDAEYAYLFDTEARTMRAYAILYRDKAMRLLWSGSIDGTEPDWSKMEEPVL